MKNIFKTNKDLFYTEEWSMDSIIIDDRCVYTIISCILCSMMITMIILHIVAMVMFPVGRMKKRVITV